MIVGLAGHFNPQAFLHHLFPADAARAPVGELGVPVQHLAESLLSMGHRVVVYTLHSDCVENIHLQGPNLSIHMGPYRARHRMRDVFAAERTTLVELMRSEVPDILHVHWGYEFALAAATAKVAPIVMTLHDWAPAILRFQPSLYRLGRLFMWLAAIFVTRHLVATSPHVESKVRRWLFRRCIIIPDGLSLKGLASGPRRFPDGAPLLVAANQGFSGFKNIGSLLQAFPAIRAAFPGARLELLGHGHEPGGEAERWAAARNLTEGVDFIGQIPAPEVPKRFARAHLMVHPSLEEAFGHVLIEALSQGVPVVAAREAAAPAWILGYGHHGVLAQAKSPASLAQACIAVLSDSDRWEGLSRTGWEAARDTYSMDRVAASYLELYRSVL